MIAVGASSRALGKFLELDDRVDVGAHGDVGDALQDEFDDHRHLMFLHQAFALANASCELVRARCTRIALQPSPSATATWSTP